MLLTQACVDILQFFASLPRYYYESKETHFMCRPLNIFIGLLLIDWVEYWCHRMMHTLPLLRQIHKKHHNLIPVHTFGAYYNSSFEALFLGGTLAMAAIGGCGLSVLELSISASFGTFMTVLDHTPAAFYGIDGLSDHEIHHNVCSNCNFSQPFWPFLDWLFATRFEDVMRREGKDPVKYLMREREKIERRREKRESKISSVSMTGSTPPSRTQSLPNATGFADNLIRRLSPLKIFADNNANNQRDVATPPNPQDVSSSLS